MATTTTNRLNGTETANGTSKAAKAELPLSALKNAQVSGKIKVHGAIATMRQPLAKVTGFSRDDVLRDMQNPLNDQGTVTIDNGVIGADGKNHKTRAKVAPADMAAALAAQLDCELPSVG